MLTSTNVGKVIKTTDALNNSTYTIYDKYDRQIATYDATKHRTSASLYDAVDRVISSTDTFSQNTTTTYLDTARKKLTLTPLGLLITETTDTAGNLTEIIDSIHPATRYQYDKRNRKTKIIDATGGETLYTYYLDGQTKSVTDAVNNTTTYLYDTAGRLIQENSPLGSRQYQYDLVNNRTQGKDRNGRITEYGYDNLNRVKSEQWAGNGQTFTYAYDRNSNLTSTQDGNIRYEYAYDNTDLLEKVDRISGTNPKVTFKYTYDEIGNLTIAEELIANVLKATTSYEYADPRYLNTKITQTGVGLATKQVKFTYDATGLNRKVERYLDGLLKLTTTNAYDTYGRLTGIKQENNSGATIANDLYDLDNLNRLQAQTKDGNARAIVYDNTDQVKTVTGSNSEAYTYDLNGNRMGGGYVTDTGNRLMSDGTYSYEYDAEGNRTKRTKIADNTVDEYRWDYRNRLTQIVSKNAGGSVIKTVGYDYDVDDQRVKKTVTSATPSAGDGVENYYLDRNQIAFVTDGSGNQTFHYLYGLNVDAVMAQDSSAGMVWALADRLGSIETLTDKDGNVVNKRNFDSFGRILSETNPSVQFRYGYTGRERDLESGLDYYRARYYDPQVGRFISVDPMGFGAGDTNLYRYVFNNATNHTDPSGQILPLLAAFWVGGLAVAGAGAVFGGVTSFAKSLANSYDNGEQLSLGVIGNALGEGVKGAAIGAAYGFAIGGALAATAVASPFLAAAAGAGFAAYGLYGNASSAVENFQQKRYASAGVDLVSALFDVKGVRDGVGQSVSAAKAGKFYNKSSDWDGVARNYVNEQRDNNSGMMWNLMTLAKERTIGHEMGDTMLGGRVAGMGPGAMYRREFDSNPNGHIYDDIPDPWLNAYPTLSDPWLDPSHGISVPNQFLPASSMAELAARVHIPSRAGNFSDLPSDPSIREVLSRLPANAVPDGNFFPIPGGSQIGAKFKWIGISPTTNQPVTFRFRLHDPDPGARANSPTSNAGNGWIYRLQEGQRFYDPKTNKFYQKNKLNDDDSLNNDTHTPMQTPPQDIIDLM